MGLPATLSCTVDIARSANSRSSGCTRSMPDVPTTSASVIPKMRSAAAFAPGDGRVGTHDDDRVREQPGEIGEERRIHGFTGVGWCVPARIDGPGRALETSEVRLTGSAGRCVRFPAPWMPWSPAAPASSDRTSSTRSLARGDRVRVLDDLSTGRRENLAAAAELVEGSVADEAVVARAVDGVEVVFHLGALGAVARSVADPRASNAANVDGTLNVLDPRPRRRRAPGGLRVVEQRLRRRRGRPDAGVRRRCDPAPRTPTRSSQGSGTCRLFAELYPIETVALRYFNVFGPRQRPDSTYAAVIPLFAAALLAGERPTVHGDGTQSRDFTFVSDVVAANLAAAAADPARRAVRRSTSRRARGCRCSSCSTAWPRASASRRTPSSSTRVPATSKISCADASPARDVLGWAPTVSVADRRRALLDVPGVAARVEDGVLVGAAAAHDLARAVPVDDARADVGVERVHEGVGLGVVAEQHLAHELARRVALMVRARSGAGAARGACSRAARAGRGSAGAAGSRGWA